MIGLGLLIRIDMLSQCIDRARDAPYRFQDQVLVDMCVERYLGQPINHLVDLLERRQVCWLSIHIIIIKSPHDDVRSLGSLQPKWLRSQT